MTQAQLAQFVRVQAQTMGKTLSRLESHGHIVRVRSTSDRRSHVVSLTERGKEAVAAAVEMERSVLASASIDPEVLRQELKAVVRELASQFGTVPSNAAALVENSP
ncbi:transcriptional regulator [Arthrobacter nitrophenolicus]|nr:transcriptional regulator [Arthrobacter nitrophenolicus]